MQQRLIRQVVVDESRLRADGPERKPDEDEGVRIDKVHGDDLILLDAEAPLDPRAIPQHFLVRLAVGPRVAREQQERLVFVRRRLRPLFERVEQIQPVALLAHGAVDRHIDEGRDELPVVADMELSVEVGEEGRGRGQGEAERDLACRIDCRLAIDTRVLHV